MKKSFGAKTLIFPAPVWCVGSYDTSGKPNIMTIAWGGICCSKPPCVTISLRKATYTYGNIMERKAFTLNVPSEQYVQEADYFGIASGRDVDKFKETGLTAVPVNLHWCKNRVKLQIALARGKKAHDKRESLKERAQKRDNDRLR